MKKLFNRFFKRIHESAAVALLGSGVLEKVRILWVLICRSFQHTLLHVTEGALNYATPFHFSYNNVSFTIILRSHEEVALFYEIFCRKVYDVRSLPVPRTIVDLGANTGISTLFLHTTFPHARIVAVEANPKIFQLLKDRLVDITNSVAVHSAVSTHSGEVDFFVNQHSLSSSLTQRVAGAERIKVPSSTLRDILETYASEGVDLLVFDIEGAEEFFLLDTYTLTRVRALLGEIHEDLMGVSLEHFLSALREAYTVTIEPTKKKERYILRGIQK